MAPQLSQTNRGRPSPSGIRSVTFALHCAQKFKIVSFSKSCVSAWEPEGETCSLQLPAMGLPIIQPAVASGQESIQGNRFLFDKSMRRQPAPGHQLHHIPRLKLPARQVDGHHGRLWQAVLPDPALAGGDLGPQQRVPVPDVESFLTWLLTDFQISGETVMAAPAAGFYKTPGLGKDEIRIAYVLEEAELEKAVNILVKGLEKYADLL